MKIKLNVISGLLKSRSIEVYKKTNMRPMLSRARVTLFDILYNMVDLKNKTVLDICCGSGILAIEALSRGSEKAYFFDMDRQTCMELKKNLELLDLSVKSEVIKTNVFIPPQNKNTPAHIVFIDLPYKSSFLIQKIFKKFYLSNWIDENTLFIVATDKNEKLNLEEITIIQEKVISNTKLWFLNRTFKSVIAKNSDNKIDEDMEKFLNS